MIQAVIHPAPASTSRPDNDPFRRIVGQRRAVPYLREIRDGICLGSHPHPLLFLGRSGQGKTSLSKAFADSIGAEFVRIDCGPELKSEHLVERLIGLKSLAVVLCDEIQNMRRKTQSVLFSAIDSSLVPKLERGRLDRCAAQVSVMPFVLIGATNEPGRLLPALRARMINVVLDDYSDGDLREIVLQKARRFLLRLSDKSIDLIIRASGGSPRTIVQILQSVEVTSASWRFNHDLGPDAPGHDSSGHDSATYVSSVRGDPVFDGLCRLEHSVGDMVGDTLAGSERDDVLVNPGSSCSSCIPDEIVERALTWMGLDCAGLDATGRTVLSTIAKHQRATAELLATVLGLDIAFTREILAQLRSKSYVAAAPGRGWTLTEPGTALVRELGLMT